MSERTNSKVKAFQKCQPILFFFGAVPNNGTLLLSRYRHFQRLARHFDKFVNSGASDTEIRMMSFIQFGFQANNSASSHKGLFWWSRRTFCNVSAPYENLCVL